MEISPEEAPGRKRQREGVPQADAETGPKRGRPTTDDSIQAGPSSVPSPQVPRGQHLLAASSDPGPIQQHVPAGDVQATAPPVALPGVGTGPASVPTVHAAPPQAPLQQGSGPFPPLAGYPGSGVQSRLNLRPRAPGARLPAPVHGSPLPSRLPPQPPVSPPQVPGGRTGAGAVPHVASGGSELRRRSSARPPQPVEPSPSSPPPLSTALVPVSAAPPSSSALVPALLGMSEDDLIAEFQCPICFDLLCRPVPIDCGMVVCESCLARTLKHNYTQNSRPPACPVLGPTCRHGPVLRLPNVQAVLHNHLRSLLPQAYERRLQEDEENRDLVKLVREAADNSSGIISRAALLGRRPRAPPAAAQAPRGFGHPAMVELQGIFQQLREDMEVLAAEPIRFPPVLVAYPRLRLGLQYLLPTLLTMAAFTAFPGTPPEGHELSTLRAMSSTAFAQSYVVKSMGWWDVGLLMTCHRQPGFLYQVPQPLRSRLARLKSIVWSRFLWPYERLLLASWMDPYHRLMATYYTVTWSLTTLYLLTYCISHRVQRRRQEGVPLKRIVVGEAGLLASLLVTCELWNVLWWWVCRFKFRVFECSMDYRLTPANIIENSIISLLLELIFIFTLFMGATVDPNDYALLTCTWLDQPDEWERDLQVTVLSRFAFVYVPRSVLNWWFCGGGGGGGQA